MTSRSRVEHSARGWLALGMLSSACLLWWAFARTERVAIAVFGVAPGQTIHDPEFAFRRVVAVWVAGVITAALILAAAAAMRNRPVVGRSPEARLFFVANLALAVLVWMTVRELIHKPVVSPAIALGLVAYVAAASYTFLRRSRGPAS